MDLRYPVGKFTMVPALSAADRQAAISAIAALPEELTAAAATLTDAQLDTPYRPEGWTVRQVVHHVADSHINAYCRTRFALTEQDSPIRAYNEADWARLADAHTMPATVSLALIEALHARWIVLLRSLAPSDFERAIMHPENGRMTIDAILAMYSWHGRHHTAHITGLRQREGWT